MRYPDGRILVFAKAPVPGYAKTRLIPALGAVGAATLQEKLIRNTVTMACESRPAPVELWTSGATGETFFADLGSRFRCELKQQQGADLGARMSQAFETTLRTARFAVLIGTDCPLLDAAYLEQACAALQNGSDAVLGPAEDGGYVLIGLRHAEIRVFSDIAWGTASVLAQTRERIRLLEWKCHELPERWDIDRPGDIQRLATFPDQECGGNNQQGQ